MKLRLKYLIFVLALIPSLGFAKKCLLPAYTATYTAYIKGAKAGDMTTKLSYAGNAYKYTSTTNLRYLLYHDKLFRGVRGYVLNNKLIPMRYYYGTKSGGSNRSHSIKKGAYDLMTYQLQLRRELLAGKSTFSFLVCFGKKKKKRLNFSVIQRKYPLKTPLGTLETVVVVAVGSNGSTTTYWFSKKYQYLMLKSETRRGSKIFGNMQIKSYHEKSGGACPIEALTDDKPIPSPSLSPKGRGD